LQAQEEKFSYQLDEETGKVIYQAVVEQSGTQEELFNRCIYFLNDFYNDPVRVTNIRDIQTGKIEGSYRFRIYYSENNVKTDAGMINYSFTIEMKDNKYRYTVSDIYLKSTTNRPVERWLNKEDPAYDPRWDSYIQQITDYFYNWSTRLNEKMKPEKEKKKDEW
jgi:hypothetical protein